MKSGKPIVLCVNKVDNVGEPPMELYEFYNLGLGEPFPVSSVHGHGTGDLLDEVLKYLPEKMKRVMTTILLRSLLSASLTLESPL